MSNLFPHPELARLPQHEVKLGDLAVRRLLPVRGRRMIGPWCFLDRFGPLQFQDQKPMDVAPHPHIGLQTLTWLFSGEVLHNDSLGNECMIRPGQVSLMTAGKGIAHTEETPGENSGLLDGVQFWIALPEAQRGISPSYLCTKELRFDEWKGATSVSFIPASFRSAPAFQAMSGNEYRVHPGSVAEIALLPSFEYGVVLVQGDGRVEGEELALNTLYYLAPGAHGLAVASRGGATILVLGGEPFGEQILMWWNFVARTEAEILEARSAWVRGEVFGEVPRYAGERLSAPPITGHLVKRGAKE